MRTAAIGGSRDCRDALQLTDHAADKKYSFTGCVSFVLINRLGIKQAAALDNDFRREGFEVLP